MLSWVGLFLGVLGLWIAGKHNYGWLVAASASIPWIVYAIPRHIWALVVTSIIYGVIDFRNYVLNRD